MVFSWWRTLVNRKRNTSRQGLLSKATYRFLAFENLESRLVPSGTARPLFEVFQPQGAHPLGSPSPVGLQPAQIRHAYGIDQILLGGIAGDGTGQTIAIIDAFNDTKLVSSTDPNFSTSDLHVFDQQLGLPDPPSFTKLAQDGTTNYPGTDPSGGWETEESLDVEWAHAVAPQANILLVEANSAGDADLNTAVDLARNYPGVVVVSMSYGGGEFSSETAEDGHFTTPAGHGGVTFVASSGDGGAPGLFPAYSPTVMAVGGTFLTIDSANNYVNETGWSGSGGGVSQFEAQPAYQQGVVTQSTTKRTIPDIAFDASPKSGVAVYDTFNHSPSTAWLQIGGTSVSAPCWAGLIAIADQGRALAGKGPLDGAKETLPALYDLPGQDFRDVTFGSNNGFSARPGYDLVTGIGTPVANRLVPDLAATADPVTLTWTGGGTTANWSDPNNWGGTAPQAGDSLVFGAGAAALTATNDLSPDTFFHSITLSGAGYAIAGNPILLTGGINASSATGTNVLDLGVSLGGNQTVTAGGSGTALTLGGNIDTGGFALTLAGSGGTLELSGSLGGSGGLTDNSTGIVTLGGSAANTFTGATTVNSGTFILGKSSGPAVSGALRVGDGTHTALVRLTGANETAAGSAVTVNAGGTFDLAGNADMVASLTLTAGTVQTGTGTLTLTGNLTSSGTSTVGGNLVLGGGTEVFTVSSLTLTVQAVVGGAGALSKAGGGTLVLASANSYSGGTTLTAGTLVAGTGTSLGAGPLALGGGTFQSNGSAISLANNVALGGNATLGGSANLTFSGTVTLTGNRTLTVSNKGLTTFAGAVGETGGIRSLTKSGPGTLVLAVANSYSGGTTLSNGTLALGDGGALGTGTLTVTAGTLQTNGRAVSLANPVTLGGNVGAGGSANLTFTGPVTLTGNRTLSVSNTGVTTFAGTVAQSGGTWSLTKTGAGTLVLSGAESYAGTTAVNGGTLLVNGSVPGAVTVASTATVGGTGTLGPVTLTTGGTLLAGTATSAAAVLSSGNLSFASGSKFRVPLDGTNLGAGGYGEINVTGSVNLGGTTLSLSVAGGFTPAVGESFTLINNDGTEAVVGTFNGLAQGATFNVSGKTYQISYVGGDGNDVVITRIA
jgi:autotransporter-associated beta strand protein